MTNGITSGKSSKPSMKDRLKKMVKPAVLVAVAAMSYVAGLKTAGNSQDSMEPLRESLGGITHAVFEGGNGSRLEVSNQGYTVRSKMYNAVNGITTETVYDGVNGVTRSSDGTTMKVNANNEWEVAPLTKADEAFLTGNDASTDGHSLESTQPVPPPIAVGRRSGMEM